MRLSHLVGAALGTGLLFLAAAGGAQAYDHASATAITGAMRSGARRPSYEPRYVHERPIVVRERPVYVERSRPSSCSRHHVRAMYARRCISRTRARRA